MGKGKKKSHASSGDKKAVRVVVEKAVNEGVKLQDSASELPSPQASAALDAAAKTYRGALATLPGHADAAYNLATCLSELADLKTDMREQVELLRESRSLLESVIQADTSGRGATTALAYHALGNVIRATVDVFREHCPAAHGVERPVGYPSAAECKNELVQACRHLETAVTITRRLQNQPGDVEEILIHLGDAFASMMQMAMDDADGATTQRTRGGHPPSPPSSSSAVVQEVLALCSNACSKYSEALASEFSVGDSDTDILRLKAGTVVNFLDWALPDALRKQTNPVDVCIGFSAEALIAAGEDAVRVLLGLDGNNVAGLLAKGDLCRLRARLSMLSGAGVQQEGALREESVAWFAKAIAAYPHDPEVLTAAGEGLLEYGRRSMELYNEVALASAAQGGHGAVPHAEGMRMSAAARLQEAGNLLSRACAIDNSDTDTPYNAACAFALSGDPTSCYRALSEYCRRLTLSAAPAGGGSSCKRDSARWSLREASSDVDLEAVRGASWFVSLLMATEGTIDRVA